MAKIILFGMGCVAGRAGACSRRRTVWGCVVNASLREGGGFCRRQKTEGECVTSVLGLCWWDRVHVVVGDDAHIVPHHTGSSSPHPVGDWRGATSVLQFRLRFAISPYGLIEIPRTKQEASHTQAHLLFYLSKMFSYPSLTCSVSSTRKSITISPQISSRTAYSEYPCAAM